MKWNSRAGWRVLDAVWLAALMLYVVAGYQIVPFHGDESTLLYMSRDYYWLVQTRNLDPVLYPDSPVDEHLRIVNGTVPKMAMGFAWDMAGLTVDNLNAPWIWDTSWEWNVTSGHMPGERLLYAGRLSSAALLAISVAAVFAIGWMAGRGRAGAWAASLIYATTPAVLLNGRRSMMEGAFLCFSTLAILVALMVIREQAHAPRPRRGILIAWTALFGVTGGFALASKHTALFSVGAAFVIIALEPVVRKRHWEWPNRRRIARWTGAALLAALTFLALNPAWWADPVAMPERVYHQRTDLLNSQAKEYGRFSGPAESVGTLVDFSFFAAPQYFESPVWGEYTEITDQIEEYEDSWLFGRGTGLAWGGLLLALFGIGLAALIRRWREGPAWAALVWCGLTLLAVVGFTPMAWQRYYLPVHPAAAVVAGVGAAWIARRLAAAQPGLFGSREKHFTTENTVNTEKNSL